MDEHNNEKLLKDIKDSLDYLDKKTQVKLPDLTQIRGMVARVEEKKSKVRRRDSMIYSVAALLLLGLEISFFRLSAMLFFLITGASAIVLPVVAIIWYFYKRRRVGEV